MPSCCGRGQLQLFNVVNSNGRSIIEEVSGKDLKGSVPGLAGVIFPEFSLEDWVKS